MTTSRGFIAIGEPQRPTPAKPASAANALLQDLTPVVIVERERLKRAYATNVVRFPMEEVGLGGEITGLA
jgi:hypothetical protein